MRRAMGSTRVTSRNGVPRRGFTLTGTLADGSAFAMDFERDDTATIILSEANVPVPEPATMALLGLAACGLGGYVRKRRLA